MKKESSIQDSSRKQIITPATSSIPQTMMLLSFGVISIVLAISMSAPDAVRPEANNLPILPMLISSVILAIVSAVWMINNNKTVESARKASQLRVTEILKNNYGLTIDDPSRSIVMPISGSEMKLNSKPLEAVDSKGNHVAVVLTLTENGTNVKPVLSMEENPKQSQLV